MVATTATEDLRFYHTPKCDPVRGKTDSTRATRAHWRSAALLNGAHSGRVPDRGLGVANIRFPLEESIFFYGLCQFLELGVCVL